MKTAASSITTMALALVLSSATPACADGAGAGLPGLDFDQGINVSDVLKTVREKAAEQPAVAQHAPVQTLYYRQDQDCASFTIGPNDNPQTGEVWLRSTEWTEECYPVPGGNHPYPRHGYQPYPPGGNYPYPPGGSYPYPPGGYHPGPGGQNCYERPYRTYEERASVAIRDRQPMFPWEYDSFEVCLQGPWLSLRQRETAYEYKVVQGGNYDGRYVVAPIRKLAMKPDPAGILAQALSPNMALTFKDKWASYYAGEQTVLILKLRKDVPNWFDSTLLEKQLSFAAADTYAVDFQAYAGEFSQKLEAGKKYYVEYSFKRVGSISKADVMKVGETGKTAYQPVPATFGR